MLALWITFMTPNPHLYQYLPAKRKYDFKFKTRYKSIIMAITQGTISSSSSPKVDIPRPKSYNGSKNARELDNFL